MEPYRSTNLEERLDAAINRMPLEARLVVEPLTTLDYAGENVVDGVLQGVLYKVICRVCGNVTRVESGGLVNDAPLVQANLYRQRHLSRHMEALANEFKETVR